MQKHVYYRAGLIAIVTLVINVVVGQNGTVHAQGPYFQVDMNKSFNPISIPAGGTSTLSVSIYNPNTFPLELSASPAAWTDTLPTGVNFANPLNVTTTCGGTVTATSNVLSVSGGTVPAQVGTVQGSCTVTIDVTSTVAGNHINTIPASTLKATDPSGTINITNASDASATLNVNAIQPPSLSKSFAPNTMWIGQTSTLTITLRNNDSNYSLTNISITDNLPANVTIASAPSTPQCNGGTVTYTSGSISLSGGSIAKSSSCNLIVTVTSLVPGVYTNNIPAGAIQTQQGVTNASAASASLNVQAIGITKSFSPANFQQGGTSTLTITLRDPTSTEYTGAGFVDTLPTGLTVANPSNAVTTCNDPLHIPPITASITASPGSQSISMSGGAIPSGSTLTPGSCTISVTVTSSTPAGYTNRIPAGNLVTDQGVTNVIAATSNITVYSTGLGVTGSKGFSPSTIVVGGVSTLTITITAPADTQLTNVSLSDALPTGVQVANPPSTTKNSNDSPNTHCGPLSTFTPAAGDTLLVFSGGTIPAGRTCTLTVHVTGNTPGVFTNTISPANITDDQNRDLSGNISTNLTVSGLTISKAFYPPTINPTGISMLTITLNNTNTTQLDSVSLMDNLPGGVTIAAAPNKSTTCNGDPSLNLTAGAGTSTIQLTNGIIPAQVGSIPGTCTINVDVTGTTAGTYNNIIPTSNVSGTIHSTSIVIHPPSQAAATLKITSITIQVVKAFNPLTVFGGSASTLSVQLINPNNIPLAGITFTDNLPQGTGANAGRGVTVANPPNPSVGTCGGTITATPGNTSFSFSGGSLAANASCTLSLSTTMNMNNNLTNTIDAGAVTTTNGATNTQAASATLTNLPGASLSKAFGPNPILAGTGNSSTLTITIQNLSNFPIDGVGLIDTLPSGLTVASSPPSSQCGGTVTSTSNSITLTGGSLADSATCDLVVSVTAPTPGSYQNCIPKGTLQDNQNATNQTAACDTLIVNPVPQPPSMTKAFSPDPIPAGGTSALTFTITNPAANTVALSGVGFTDTFPSGMTLASVPNASQCGGTVTSTSDSITLTAGTINPNSSCTVIASVTAPAGSYSNTSGAVSSTNGGTGNTASATLNVIAPPSIIKQFSPNSITVGDPAPTLTFTITNPNSVFSLTGVGFTDSFPAGLTVATAPAPSQCGGIVTYTSTSITLTGGTINASSSCSVTINVTAGGGTYANTSGAVTSTNGGTDNTASDTLTVSGPGLSFTKSTTTVGYQKAGDTINYSYLLTNTGNANLYPPYTVTDNKASSVSCPSTPNPLAPGGTVTCTAVYTVTNADVTNKSVTNIAAATALDGGGNTITSNQSSVTVNIEALTLKKSTTTAGYRSAGNTITYNYTITNTGNVTLYPPFNISDDHIGSFSCVTTPPASLAPGANLTCASKTYTVPGPTPPTSVTNIAAATAMDASSGGNTVTSNTSSVTVYQIIGPVIAKAFSPNTIQVGAISTLTFTITNPSTNAVPLIGVGFTDTFPAGVVVANPPDAAQCGGSVTSTSNSITLANGTVINDPSNINNYCTVTVDVTGTTSGVKNNILTQPVTSSNGGNGNTTSASLTVIAPPTISKSFAPNSILVGGTSTITFTIMNPNSGAILTGVGFTDALPAGMQVAGTPNANASGCNASSTPTFSPAAADTSLSFSNGSIAASGSCTVTVDVVVTTTGTVNNVTSLVTSTNGGSGNSAAASLLAVAPPTISKSFSPTSIPQGDTTTLSFTVSNPASNTVSLSGITFSDTLPSGLTVANSSSSQCNGGTLTTTAATSTIYLSGGSLNAGANCTFNVTVTGTTAGVKNNTTGNVASANGGTGNTTSASVTVIAPPTISKAFSPNQILQNGTSTLTFTLTNPAVNTSSLTGVQFTDSLPSGLQVASTPNAATNNCGTPTFAPAAGNTTLSFSNGTIAAGGTCTVSVSVYAVTGGTKNNTSGAVSSSNGGTGNTASNTLTVIPVVDLSITKDDGKTVVGRGQADVYTIVVSNAGPSDVTGATVTDNLPGTLTSATWTCVPDSGATCTASGSGSINDTVNIPAGKKVTYTLNATVSSSATNDVTNTVTVAAPSGESDSNTNNNSATDTDNLAWLSIVKSASPPTYSAVGNVISYSYTITNTGTATLYAPFAVTDDKVTPTCTAPATLAPNDSFTCTASYSIIQIDLDAGSVTNNVYATAKDSGSNTVTSNTDTKTVTAIQNPSLNLVKSANPLKYVKVGDTIDYTYVLTNTGNVTLSNPFTVTDDKTTVTCPSTPTSLAPTDTITCTGSYFIIYTDLANGSLTNKATAHAVFGTTTVDSNQDAVTVNARLGAINGTVYFDANTNGAQDSGETGISGVTVRLYNSAGTTLVATTTTDSNGHYSFIKLPADNYQVVEEDLEGYVSTTSNTLDVTVLPDETAQADFGDYQIAAVTGCSTNNIAGVVYEDINANGTVDSGEQVIPGVTITLYDQNNNVVATTTTAANGSYSFNNLPPGVYTVVETNPSGYISTTLDHVSTVMDCGTSAVVNYGAQKTSATIVDPAVTKYGDPSTAHVGDLVIYTITVGNNGNTDALNVTLSDTKPAFLDIINITVSPDKGFPVTISGNTFTINFGTVTPSDFYTVTVLTKVNNLGLPPGGVNNASITTSSLNEPTFNDSASVQLTIPSNSSGKGGGGAYWSLLPHTGFAPGVITAIAPKPSNFYDASSDLIIEIPTLGIKASIVGVPQSDNTWDVTWLGNQVGYLDGTAFPTWSGNSVLTGHVYGASGLPGPFVNLHTLKWGDQIIIHFAGQRYIYEVRENNVVSPNDTSVFKHENQPWITLITCKDYNASTDTYIHRIEIRAVLIKVTADAQTNRNSR